MATQPSCGTCFFGRSSQGPLACVRYAPAVPQNDNRSSPAGTINSYRWPHVEPSWFCGDYSATDPNVYGKTVGPVFAPLDFYNTLFDSTNPGLRIYVDNTGQVNFSSNPEMAAAPAGNYKFSTGFGLILSITDAGTIHDAPIADISIDHETVLTGFSHTIFDRATVCYLSAAGTLATGSLTMPPNPMDGQDCVIVSAQTVTALTHLPNAGQALLAPLTTIAANGFGRWRWFASELSAPTWIRIG